jgi:hypothetical protein
MLESTTYKFVPQIYNTPLLDAVWNYNSIDDIRVPFGELLGCLLFTEDNKCTILRRVEGAWYGKGPSIETSGILVRTTIILKVNLPWRFFLGLSFPWLLLNVLHWIGQKNNTSCKLEEAW